ncbi:MAG: diaminopimelate epimerase [Pseudomonadota bacterium]
MRVPFVKMHGLGNDFIVLDARVHNIPEMAPRTAKVLADRREGIGCDQVIVLEALQATDATADFRMRIFNSDGGEVESCGNASRAVALLHAKPARVSTAGGIIALEPTPLGATVDMGHPCFEWDAIPLAYAMDTSAMPMGWATLSAPMAVNVGNPHVVFFVEDASVIDLEGLGPVIEKDPVFPQEVNVNVAHIVGDDHVVLRVWERGAGLTRACGTGACATAVAAILKGLVESPVRVSLPGGDLEIEWRRGDPVRMSGPAKEAYRGEFEWDDYA